MLPELGDDLEQLFRPVRVGMMSEDVPVASRRDLLGPVEVGEVVLQLLEQVVDALVHDVVFAIAKQLVLVRDEVRDDQRAAPHPLKEAHVDGPELVRRAVDDDFGVAVQGRESIEVNLGVERDLGVPAEVRADRSQDRPPPVVELFGRAADKRRYPTPSALRASSN